MAKYLSAEEEMPRVSEQIQEGGSISNYNGKKNNLTTGHSPATCTYFPILEEAPNVSGFDVEETPETLSAFEEIPLVCVSTTTNSKQQQRVDVWWALQTSVYLVSSIFCLYLVHAGFRQMFNNRLMLGIILCLFALKSNTCVCNILWIKVCDAQNFALQ